MSNVAIIGYGFCGKATHKILKQVETINRIQIHDPQWQMYKKPITDWRGIDYAFICVPTPITDGELKFNYGHILDATVEIPEGVQIVIRSTVGPEALSHTWIHWPEFLRESHWEQDAEDMSIPIILGGHMSAVKSNMTSKSLKEMSGWFPHRESVILTGAKEAAIYKLSRNAMLAAKGVMCNYIHSVCKEQNCSYSEVASMLLNFGNLGNTHMSVPGPDGEHGFGGSCFPKDISHLAGLQLDSSHYAVDNIFDAVLECNERYRKTV
jgi:UDPglucose 6-dehydrogenase